MLGAKLKISGSLVIEIADCATQQELIEQLAFWSEVPLQCPVCGAAVVFTARHPKNFHYYGLQCTGTPGHEVNFGVRQADNVLYVKHEWKQVHVAPPERRLSGDDYDR